MHKDFKKYWQKVLRRFYTSQMVAVILMAVSTLVLTYGILVFINIEPVVEFLFSYFILLVLLFLIWSPIFKLNKTSITDYLHKAFPSLEYSLDLFFQPELNEMATIQREKILGRLPAVNKIPLTENWKSLSLLAFCSILVLSAGLFSSQLPPAKEGKQFTVKTDSLFKIMPSEEIEEEEFNKGQLQLKVNPPAYTRLPSFIWQGSRSIPEGSLLTFEVNGGNMTPRLIFQGIDTISMNKNQQGWSRKYKLGHSQAYQLYFQADDIFYMDEIHVLEVLIDQKPAIQFDRKESRVEIDWKEVNKPFNVGIHMKDDYGLTSANVVATLSQGDGEAVKFRELKWPLPGFKTSRNEQKVNYNLQMDTLGLEPGDELYFFIEVADNKQPEKQKTKSEVFIIEIADTVQQESVALDGLALSTEPEYFTSQRQIIIDTEKLLNDRKSLSQTQFEDRSDVIGAEQKILRLRYGVFLGEEYEVSGGSGKIATAEPSKDEHDEEGEEHDPEDPTIDHSGHDHAINDLPGENDFSDDKYEAPELEAYVHSHDHSDIATFFDADVKIKLKEALANMWEAELFLRTYRPQKALPYEYKALELIKEVQRASRIYVLRMGFEPPPLEPDEKRLTGDLEAIDAGIINYDQERDNFLLQLRDILQEMKKLDLTYDILKQQKIVNKLSDLIVSETLKNPVRYALLLSEINEYNHLNSRGNYRNVMRITEQVLPDVSDKLSAEETMDLKLKNIFHQQLEIN